MFRAIQTRSVNVLLLPAFIPAGFARAITRVVWAKNAVFLVAFDLRVGRSLLPGQHQGFNSPLPRAATSVNTG